MLLSREYGYPTSISSLVDLTTPRTGLATDLYQAIRAINSENGEVLLRVRPKPSRDWKDVGPCDGKVCVADDAVAAAMERSLYAGQTPVRMNDECGPRPCSAVLGAMILIEHDTSSSGEFVAENGACSGDGGEGGEGSGQPHSIISEEGICVGLRAVPCCGDGSQDIPGPDGEGCPGGEPSQASNCLPQMPFQYDYSRLDTMASGVFNTSCNGDVSLCNEDGSLYQSTFYQDIRDTAMTIFTTTNRGSSPWNFIIAGTDSGRATKETSTFNNITGILLSTCGQTRTAKSLVRGTPRVRLCINIVGRLSAAAN